MSQPESPNSGPNPKEISRIAACCATVLHRTVLPSTPHLQRGSRKAAYRTTSCRALPHITDRPTRKWPLTPPAAPEIGLAPRFPSTARVSALHGCLSSDHPDSAGQCSWKGQATEGHVERQLEPESPTKPRAHNAAINSLHAPSQPAGQKGIAAPSGRSKRQPRLDHLRALLARARTGGFTAVG
jgi:hypothetical protein